MTKGRKVIMYNSRQAGRSLLYHEWFREMIPTLKDGWKMGIPVKDGIAVFEFRGIQKPKSDFIIEEL